MKSGSRALGIAESYTTDYSTLAGVVMTHGGTIDDFVFGSCTVGGDDATQAIIDMVDRLDRDDIRHVLVSGVALAWFNILDLAAIADAVDRPVISVTYEASDGLTAAIREAFDADSDVADRLARYHALPDRHALAHDATTLYLRVRGCSLDEATAVIRAMTPPSATKPRPLHVAALAARGADEWQTTNPFPTD